MYSVGGLVSTALICGVLFYVTLFSSLDQFSALPLQDRRMLQLAEKSSGNLRDSSGAKKCTPEENKFQWDNIDLAEPSICDSTSPWRLAQLAYPDMTTFIDIGANRGYTAALIAGLWSPGSGLSRQTLSQATLQDFNNKLTSNKDNLETVCGDNHIDPPIICPGKWINTGVLQRQNFNCNFRRSISIFSIDGQEHHVKNTRETIYRHFPLLNPSTKTDPAYSDIKANWEYIYSAVTGADHKNETKGFFLFSTSESGKLLYGDMTLKPDERGFEVPVTTVDRFARERQLQVIDIIKVDAEGFDTEVVRGAKNSLLKRGVKMVVIECAECQDDRHLAFYKEMDDVYKFDCYVNSASEVMVKMNGDCFDLKLAYGNDSANYPPKSTVHSNAYCVHRRRGRHLNSMFDNLSLYKYAGNNRGNVLKDAIITATDMHTVPAASQYDLKTGKLQWTTPAIRSAYEVKTGRNSETGEKVRPVKS